MKPLGRWLAETRFGRMLFRLAAIGMVAAIAATAVLVIRQHEIDQITQRVEVIERVEPIDVLRECLRTPECRRLFRHPELLQVKGREVQVRPRQLDSGRDISQPEPEATTDPQSGNGKHADARDTPKQTPHKPTDRPSPPNAQSVPDQSSAPAPAAPQPVAPAPGNSGSTPGAGQGTRACVDLIVSACVDVPRLP